MKVNTKIVLLLAISLLLCSLIVGGLSAWQLTLNRDTSITQVQSISTGSINQIQFDLEGQRRALVAHKKEYLKSQVQTAIGVLEKAYDDAHDTKKLQEAFRIPLQNALDTAYSIIVDIQNRPELSLEEKKQTAARLVGQLRYGPGNKDYFWINDMGEPYPKMVMHPISPALNGQVMDDPKYDCAMGKNQNLFQAMTQVCKSDGAGFVDYLWPKPGHDKPQPKLSYVRLIKEWNWVIGTGVYLEVAEQKLKQDAMEIVARLRYGPENENYFWINNMGEPFPVMIMHPVSPSLDGQVMDDPQYNCALGKEKNLFKAIIAVCKEEGGGFIDYLWPKEGHDKPQPKLSYVKLLKEWNWVIGTGIYVDDIETLLMNSKAEVDKKVAAFAAEMNQQIDLTKTNIDRNVAHGLWLIALGSLAVLGLVLVVAVIWTRKSITRPIIQAVQGLSGVTHEVTSNAGNVSSSSQQLAEGASEQAASLEETNAAMKEMATMTRSNADHSNQADGLMKEARKVIAEAGQGMEEMTASMDQIAEAGGEISKIVNSIDEVAFQTNLLALNAAVEAARAGEAGAGFAVVANEVRALALRAAEAAKNTQALVEQTVSRISQGSELVSKTQTGFRKVAETAGKVASLVSEIAAASAEQSQGIDQVNIAISQMDQVVQRTAASAEESASVSEELNNQARTMKDMVALLAALVAGNGNGAGTASGGRGPRGRRTLRPGAGSESKADPGSRPALTHQTFDFDGNDDNIADF